jgi:putative membrane protein
MDSTNFRLLRYFPILAAIFAAEWRGLAVEPYDRHDWLLENALVFLVVVIFVLSYKRFSFQ